MPGQHVVNAGDEVVGGDVLQHVRLRAGPQRARDVLVGVVGREHDHPRLRIALANPAHHLDAFHHRHPQIEQRHVGAMTLARLERVGAVARLGDDAQVGFLVDDVRDAGAEQRVIVHHEDARQAAVSTAVLRRRHGPAPARSWAATPARLPLPTRGAVTMVSDAPMRSARSCMLVIPNPAARCSRAMPRPSSATDRRKPID